MVKVLVVRDGDNAIKMFEIKGHSGYNEAGRDIVCSAASVTAFTAAGALGELAGINDCYIERNGYLKIKLPKEVDDTKRQSVDIIMKTAYIGFKQIEESYPKYLKVRDKHEGK
jgi:uncharacterized protein YsxB (DUF464 family)